MESHQGELHCELCGVLLSQPKRCGRCQQAFYCCRDHQKEHWRAGHRKLCSGRGGGGGGKEQVTAEQQEGQLAEQVRHMGIQQHKTQGKRSEEEEASASRASEAHPMPPQVQRKDMPTGRPDSDWLSANCRELITRMDRVGLCVLDNFLGEEKGSLTLAEVQQLYDQGLFNDGQVVKGGGREGGGGGGEGGRVRGDKVLWVRGDEVNCPCIIRLMRVLDALVLTANQLHRSRGRSGTGAAARPGARKGLGEYVIRERSKGMVACYPSGGTRYVKHVDNPGGDGRCLTAIYYLNKDWSSERDGGLLRIFPEGQEKHVAVIEPAFDRVVFFWSDRRNPHEVQPAFRTRFAITVWYYDSQERSEFLHHKTVQQQVGEAPKEEDVFSLS